MTTLVLHIGARKTATTHIQRSLHLNEERLEAAGVYIPRAARAAIGEAATYHHNLAWEIRGDRRYHAPTGGWAALAQELDEVRPATALVSSEILDRLLTMPGRAKQFLDTLRDLGHHVRMVVAIRDCLEYVNSLYAQLIKMLAISFPFEVYVRDSVGRGDVAVYDKYRPLIEDPAIDFRVVSYQAISDGDPLQNLLRAVDIEPPGGLEAPVGQVNPSLGTTGVEITRLLQRYLLAKHPDFEWASRAGRRLHRASAQRLRTRNLSGDRFWGFDEALATEVADSVLPQHDALSTAVWGTPWPFELNVDRPRNVASFDEFTPRLTRATVAHLRDMTQRYEQLHAEDPG